MSLVFNDTSSLKGLVQEYEREIGADVGAVSGNTVRLKQFTASANQALDDFTVLALQAGGTWQWDDSNQTDYPIIRTNIVSAQRDYTFTTDESGNLILDIYRVRVADSAGNYKDITPVDLQTSGQFAYTDTATGVPTAYDKTANGILFKEIPNYNYTNGLEVYINREGSYFVYTDTTKKAGVPGIFHRYFVLRPAEDHTRRVNAVNYPAIRAERTCSMRCCT